MLLSVAGSTRPQSEEAIEATAVLLCALIALSLTSSPRTLSSIPAADKTFGTVLGIVIGPTLLLFARETLGDISYFEVSVSGFGNGRFEIDSLFFAGDGGELIIGETADGCTDGVIAEDVIPSVSPPSKALDEMNSGGGGIGAGVFAAAASALMDAAGLSGGERDGSRSLRRIVPGVGRGLALVAVRGARLRAP